MGGNTRSRAVRKPRGVGKETYENVEREGGKQKYTQVEGARPDEAIVSHHQRSASVTLRGEIDRDPWPGNCCS
jgi:hypothetical protein